MLHHVRTYIHHLTGGGGLDASVPIPVMCWQTCDSVYSGWGKVYSVFAGSFSATRTCVNYTNEWLSLGVVNRDRKGAAYIPNWVGGHFPDTANGCSEGWDSDRYWLSTEVDYRKAQFIGIVSIKYGHLPGVVDKLVKLLSVKMHQTASHLELREGSPRCNEFTTRQLSNNHWAIQLGNTFCTTRIHPDSIVWFVRRI